MRHRRTHWTQQRHAIKGITLANIASVALCTGVFVGYLAGHFGWWLP